MIGADCSITNCDFCKVGFYLHINGGTKTCVAQANIPDGLGIESQFRLELASCTDSNCKTCINDNTKCEVCTSSTKYSNEDTGFVCTDMPANHGFNTRNPDVISPCAAGVGCASCTANYQTCSGCSATYYMKVDTGICVTEAQIPDKYGHQNGNFNQIVSCSDGLCKDCKADHQVYVECDAGNYVDEGTGVCGVCDVNNRKWIDNKHCRACHSSCREFDLNYS